MDRRATFLAAGSRWERWISGIIETVHISTMSRVCVTGLIMLVLGYYPSLRAQEPAPGDELARHLATLKAQVEDTSLAIGQREALVQEMAGTFHRAGRG